MKILANRIDICWDMKFIPTNEFAHIITDNVPKVKYALATIKAYIFV